ncbi:MAG TPA: 50S ribosomal protein L31 [Elusimicrobia bacterium]|nr:MAG: 50S ribosomal protein L31 [Elusimicrobia bacterium RIFOXYA12_FULL_49_49]OGS10705.1 MAG: 50S ribosomal protein L31 [Elusimicrobia bacterium RIFOXYB1_FULL_48_9]OGS16855.1 MAG: 50S ribosomal protein L31 [Elusimicrobia bacterium RIFOXYA2_FULL_47_53]OGS32083.1 MAG: 50S ribosomal protein L31 [Elusimicrobia bacterium RIFOXYB2_FULL_46_23]HBU69976.1 50S ribosomal protein L31 [Elusimicrobiota bacterium]
MREGIHPNYVESTVTCACGYTFKTRSTKPVIRLEICSHCHPFFTGKQKLVDSAGTVERFHKRFAKTEGKTVKAVKKAKPVVAKKPKSKILSTAPRRKKSAAAPKAAAPKKAEPKKESK